MSGEGLTPDASETGAGQLPGGLGLPTDGLPTDGAAVPTP
jgi:hypothetical protein